MTEEETIRRIKDYSAIVKGVRGCWVGENTQASIIKILSSRIETDYKERDVIKYKAVCYSNSRSVTYQTSDPRIIS